MRLSIIQVLHINSYFNSSSFYKNFYDKQILDGIDLKVFVPISHNVQKSNEDLGEYTNVSSNHTKFDRFFFYLKHRKIYLDLIKKYNVSEFNLSHAHSLFSNGYIAMKLKQNFNVPYVVAVRNTDVNIFFKKMPHLRKLGIRILKEASKVVFISESYRDFVINKYIPLKLRKPLKNKSIVIPNGIDDFWFENNKDKEYSINENIIKILAVGDINKNKNIQTTIKALKVLKKKDFEVKLTVVGKIKDKNIFEHINKVEFINYIAPQKKENLLEIYRDNDFLVMPSYKETFGLVYAEAMSQGLPVIYTKNQGFDNQFENGKVGYAVDPFCPEEIAEKIEKLLKKYKETSTECLKSSRKFDWGFLQKDYKKIYLSIISN